MPNTSKPNIPENSDSDTSIVNETQDTKKPAVPLADLPVLAKNSYYLSRLERELARAAVPKNKKI
ncbi:hypothetical protein [Psychrobacter sp. JCM 18901]|uniref:hypothetical protein n=1 Tax=Psychrobacter sp. JCM 18901 TaxID=1298609 RepID=UPI0004B052F3|nr:hypothetical protein [Psychrobacter sp. JCM 18901]